LWGFNILKKRGLSINGARRGNGSGERCTDGPNKKREHFTKIRRGSCPIIGGKGGGKKQEMTTINEEMWR